MGGASFSPDLGTLAKTSCNGVDRLKSEPHGAGGANFQPNGKGAAFDPLALQEALQTREQETSGEASRPGGRLFDQMERAMRSRSQPAWKTSGDACVLPSAADGQVTNRRKASLCDSILDANHFTTAGSSKDEHTEREFGQLYLVTGVPPGAIKENAVLTTSSVTLRARARVWSTNPGAGGTMPCHLGMGASESRTPLTIVRRDKHARTGADGTVPN